MRFCLSLLFVTVFSLAGTAQTFTAANDILNPLIRAVYGQQSSDAEIETLAAALLKEISDDSRLPQEEHRFAQARVYYYLGKNYLLFDNQQTIFRHNELQKKGAFTRLKDLYTEIDIIQSKYNQALEILDLLEDSAEEKADIYCLKASVLSDLCLINSVGFILLNGPKILSYIRKSLKRNPSLPQALLARICAEAYPPGIYGGNPEKALSGLEKLSPQMNTLNSGEQFDFYCAKAFALGRLNRIEEGLTAINEALMLFPTNYYANAVKILLERGEF